MMVWRLDWFIQVCEEDKWPYSTGAEGNLLGESLSVSREREERRAAVR